MSSTHPEVRAADSEDLVRRLLAWYDNHARALPWRAAPGKPPMDPYRVWLSEIMLQQTTVVAAGPYFAAFTARWPAIADLAARATIQTDQAARPRRERDLIEPPPPVATEAPIETGWRVRPSCRAKNSANRHTIGFVPPGHT